MSDRDLSTTRRTFLRTGAVLGTLGAGTASGRTVEESAGIVGTDSSTDSGINLDWWPMFRHNLENTGAHSSLSGPTGPTAEDWTFRADDTVISSPAVVDGTVYVGSHDGKLYALGTQYGNKEWEKDLGAPIYSSPTVSENTVFIGCDDGNVYQFQASNGDQIFSENLGGPVRVSPAVDGSVVYVSSNMGSVKAINWNTLTIEWERNLSGAVANGPALDTGDGTVLFGEVRNRYSKLRAMATSDGSDKWVHEADYFVTSSPAINDGSVYVGIADSNTKMKSLSFSDGSVEWETTVDNFVISSPAVTSGAVVFGSDDGNVYALETVDGSKRWEFSTGEQVRSSPAVVDGTVFVGSSDGVLYAIDLATGTEVWSKPLGAPVESSPAVHDNRIYVGNHDGEVVQLRPSPLLWQGASDWDSAVSESSVVHYDGTVQDADTITLGYQQSASDLVAYYNMDDDTGPISDLSGNGHSGTIQGGGVQTGDPGILRTESLYFLGEPTDSDDDGNLDFDGGYLDLGTDPADAMGSAFTWSAWIKLPSETNSPVAGDEDAIIAANLGPNASTKYGGNIALYVRGAGTASNADGHLAAFDGGFHQRGDGTDNTPTVVTDERWHHVALTWASADSGYDATLYVDGSEEYAFSSSASINTSESEDGADVFSIGQAYDGTTTDSNDNTVPNPTDFFEGHIEDVRLYGTALSSAEVSSLADPTSGSLVTDVREFDSPAPVGDLALTDVTANVGSDTTIEIVVESDPAGDGSFSERSDPVALDGSGGPYSVRGLSSESARFRLDISLSTSVMDETPAFGGATLVSR